VIQQFHVVLDRSPEHSGLANIKAMWGAVFDGLFPLNGSNEETAAMIGVATLVVMLLWEKFRPTKLKLVPGALLGIGICRLVGAFPMIGVIVRSSANVRAGAETRRSTIMHGAWTCCRCLRFHLYRG
jgi:MFS superfamily sulfate permease-like transporter